jgi:hypothetical protein
MPDSLPESIPDGLSRSLGDLQRSTESLNSLARYLNNNAEAWRIAAESAKKVAEVIGPIIEMQGKWVDYAQEWKRRNDEEKRAMLESGWWPTPSLMEQPANRIDRAVADFIGGRNDAISSLFYEVYQSDDCKYLQEIVHQWFKRSSFEPWKRHLEEALEAHKTEKYALSIPVLLLVAEGMAGRFCETKVIEVGASAAGKKVAEAIKRGLMVSHDYMVSDLDVLMHVIENVIYENTKKLKGRMEEDILNRHAVLHGLKPDYGTRKSSLRAFMLLDLLSALE